MPLKQLELENFKSYRGRQVIGPFSSFSAVIGPNGSGKSNLLDAISFVLCVNSANLRATHLRDLIFRQGSVPDSDNESDLSDPDDAEPLLASVTAVIEDNKSIDHRFQRSIFPSGGSEYRYNGRVVSQPLYTTRLEQLNVLIRARNCLVFQGDVEAIAAQDSRDLSRLVDEISGSSALQDEYDSTKREYTQAVERSSLVMSRRKTLQAQVRQLRQQHEATERHRSLREQHSLAVIRHILWRLYHIHEIIEIHTDWIEAHAARGEQLRKKDEERHAAVAEARSTLGRFQEGILAKEGELKQLTRALEARQPEKERLAERILHMEKKLAQAESLHSQTRADAKRQQEAIDALDRDVELVQRASRHAKDEQDAALSASSVQVDDADVQMYHELRVAADRTATKERREAEQVRRELRIKNDVFDGARHELDGLVAKRERLEHECSAAASALSVLEDRERHSRDAAASSRSRLAGMRDRREAIAARESALNESLLACYNKLLQMGQDQRVHEREGRLRESLRALRTIFPGVHGRIVELVRPTQQKYDLAITTALGRHLDAVVVDHERTAMECVEYLRNQRAGQATFIPLDTIQTRPINDRLRSVSLQARLVIDVVQYPPTIERAVHFACGNTVICDTLQVARSLSYERNERIKSVTLDGTVIHKNGMITGGPSVRDNARQWDEQEMLGVQRERDRCMSELQRLHQERYDLGDEDEAAAAVAQVDRERASIADEVAAARRRLHAAESEQEHVARAADVAAERLAAAGAAVRELQTRAEALDSHIRDADDAIFAEWASRVGVASVREYEENQLRVSQALDHATAQHQRQLARLDHQKAFTVQQLHATNERLVQLEGIIKKEKERIPRVQGEADACAADLDGMQRSIDATTAALDELRSAHTAHLDVLAERRRALHNTSRDLDTHRREIASRNDEIEQLDDERTALFRKCRLDAVDLPLSAGDLSAVPLEETSVPEPAEGAARETRDYGIEPDFSLLTDGERADRGSAKARELQEQIDAALDEMQRLGPSSKTSSRLDALQEELTACERDMDACREHVREKREEFSLIKRQRTELFMRAYNHIADRIDGVYKELTRSRAAPMGGVAYLSVEDSDEPYNTGIQYHAMPPMKRFRDMEQLSGGEKTMAALALLFATHTYKPAPFFVLDEVDAALDAQNVASVSDYIRAHASQRFQFIVISLKASLYERSQGLVGIFRDSARRSSACVTLDLEQYS